MSRAWGVALSLCCACLLGQVGPAWAQQAWASSEALWAEQLGEGMRHWAEGDYDLALKHLYQAQALKPTARTLGMIVRAHDLQGHCSAAEAQLDALRAEHPGAPTPPLQRCATPATLVFECERPLDTIVIDETMRATCDRPLRVTHGAHLIEVPALELRVRVQLAPGERHIVPLRVKPIKWSSASAPRVRRIPDSSERYSVFLSADGLYQIWVLGDAPALLPPYTQICQEGEAPQDGCKTLAPEPRDHMRRFAPVIMLLPE